MPKPSPAAASATPATGANSPPFHLLGRLPFLGDGLLAALRAEADAAWPEGAPGPVLRRLAVSRQLREAVSDALGRAVVPTYSALYQYHRPGAEVRPHRDGPGYDLVHHLTLVHERPTSVLVVDGQEVALAPGESLVLRGRDAVHGWTRLHPDERRTLVAVGFTGSIERKEAP